jgi:hypothetical protein
MHARTLCAIRSWEILGSPAEDGTAGRIGKAESRTPMMHDARKSDDSVGIEEVLEQRRPAVGGGDGEKGVNQGERGAANHAPDAEPGKRVT